MIAKRLRQKSATDLTLQRLKLRDLRTLLAVIESGNMAKAAEALSVSRPVISKTISELERTLGVRLLDRSPHGVEPTAFGRTLIKRSIAVFDELRQSLDELQHLADPGSGELRLAASEYMAAGLIPAIINRLSRKHPLLKFKLELDNPLQQLRERKVEFAIARLLSPALATDLDAEVLFHERVFIAAGADNKWAGRRKIAASDLVNEPWILAPPEIEEGSPVVELFRRLGLPIPQATVLGLSLPLRNGLLATGRFLTIVPGSVLRFGAERTLLKVLPVDLPRWHLPVAIVTLRSRTLAPLAELFLAQARELSARLKNARGPRR
jgi:DNA-binding transcriptional LysR family regulator